MPAGMHPGHFRAIAAQRQREREDKYMQVALAAIIARPHTAIFQVKAIVEHAYSIASAAIDCIDNEGKLP